MSLYGTGHSIQTCVVRVMCLSEHSSMHMHASFQFFFVDIQEHRHSTLTQVVRLTLSFEGPLGGLILFSTVSRAEGGGGLLARAATSSRRQKTRRPSII